MLTFLVIIVEVLRVEVSINTMNIIIVAAIWSLIVSKLKPNLINHFKHEISFFFNKLKFSLKIFP